MTDVDLGDNLEAYMDRLIKAGRYSTRDEVLREGLRLLEMKERRRDELDAALDRGLADIEAGRTKTADEVLAYFEEKYAASRKASKA